MTDSHRPARGSSEESLQALFDATAIEAQPTQLTRLSAKAASMQARPAPSVLAWLLGSLGVAAAAAGLALVLFSNAPSDTQAPAVPTPVAVSAAPALGPAAAGAPAAAGEPDNITLSDGSERELALGIYLDIGFDAELDDLSLEIEPTEPRLNPLMWEEYPDE